MKQVTAYEASDGKLFTDPKDAAKHSIVRLLDENGPVDAAGEPVITARHAVGAIIVGHAAEIIEILRATLPNGVRRGFSHPQVDHDENGAAPRYPFPRD